MTSRSQLRNRLQTRLAGCVAQALSETTPLPLQFRSGDATCLATAECPTPQRPPRCGSAPEVPCVRLSPDVGPAARIALRLRTGGAACLATTRCRTPQRLSRCGSALEVPPLWLQPDTERHNALLATAALKTSKSPLRV
jgi:hypothetical protein